MRIPTPDYREAGEMLGAYGRRLGEEGDDAGAQQALSSAMAIAQREADLTLEMMTLINSAWVDLHHRRLHESGEKSLRALELMDQLDNPLRGWEALIHVLRVHYNTANLVDARRYATLIVTIGEKFGNPGVHAFGLICLEKIAALGGDWTSARQFCERGVIIAPEIEWGWTVRALLEYAVGDFEQGDIFLEHLLELYRAAGPEPNWVHLAVTQTIAAVAQMTGSTKHFDVAQVAAQTVLKSQRVSPLWIWFARTGLALMAAQVGDTATVQEQYQAVRDQRGNLMLMDTDRVLGLLAAASGEMDEAAGHFDAALATWGKGRYPEYAWTAYEYADMLFKRGNLEEQDRANALLAEALSISRELGMVPLTERVRLRKESMNPR